MERVLEIALLFAVISLCFGYIALFVAENDQNVSQNTTTKSKEQFQAENDTESNRYVSIDILQEDFMATNRKNRIVIELYTSVASSVVSVRACLACRNVMGGKPMVRVGNHIDAFRGLAAGAAFPTRI